MTTVDQTFKNIQMMAKGMYADIPYENPTKMERFTFKIPAHLLTPWTNKYTIVRDLFKEANPNLLINDMVLCDTPGGFYAEILARPRTEEEIYREQLDYFLNKPR